MHQPPAPSSEWYWLESSLFSPPRTCLTPHSGWTPCDINVTYTSLKSAFDWLKFRSIPSLTIWVYLHSLSRWLVASQNRKIRRNSDKIWPYRSSRSSKVIDLGVNRKLTCATRWWRNHDASFLRFDTIPARDGQTDGRTDGHVAVAKTRASIASRG